MAAQRGGEADADLVRPDERRGEAAHLGEFDALCEPAEAGAAVTAAEHLCLEGLQLASEGAVGAERGQDAAEGGVERQTSLGEAGEQLERWIEVAQQQVRACVFRDEKTPDAWQLLAAGKDVKLTPSHYPVLMRAPKVKGRWGFTDAADPKAASWYGFEDTVAKREAERKRRNQQVLAAKRK